MIGSVAGAACGSIGGLMMGSLTPILSYPLYTNRAIAQSTLLLTVHSQLNPTGPQGAPCLASFARRGDFDLESRNGPEYSPCPVSSSRGKVLTRQRGEWLGNPITDLGEQRQFRSQFAVEPLRVDTPPPV